MFRAALRLVRARVLCPMRAPYRPITAHKNFPLPPIAGPQNCGPGCCSTPSTPLNAALVMLLVPARPRHKTEKNEQQQNTV